MVTISEEILELLDAVILKLVERSSFFEEGEEEIIEFFVIEVFFGTRRRMRKIRGKNYYSSMN